MARRPLKGIGRVRRLMRNLPDATQGEIVTELHLSGRRLRDAIRPRTPVKTGKLRSEIDFKVFPKSLRLIVGLIGSVAARRDVFYGRIQDLGRRAQVVLVQRRRRVAVDIGGGRTSNILMLERRRKRAQDIVATYRMRVRGMAPKRFITGRYPDLRREVKTNLSGIFARGLRRVAGAGE